MFVVKKKTFLFFSINVYYMLVKVYWIKENPFSKITKKKDR